MKKDKKSFVDQNKLNILLHKLKKEHPTSSIRASIKNEIISYLESFDGIIYKAHYLELFKIGVGSTVGSSSTYNVPVNRRGYLKKYRGIKILMVVIGRSQYSREVWCCPLE